MSPLLGARSPIDGQLERRMTGATLVVMVTFLVLGARLFYMQAVEGDRYRISADRNSVRTHRVKATRGIIFDRTGAILVDSRPSFDVLVVPHETPDLDGSLRRIASTAGLSLAELRQRVGQPRGRARFQALEVARDLGRDAQARILARLWALPGTLAEVTPIRAYRFGDSAAHVLGRLGEISAGQLRSRRYQDYRRGDIIGTGGIEHLLDAELRGRDGGMNVLADAHGRELELLDEVEPQPGRNIVLTLDHRLQRVAEQGLEAIGGLGAVVALDPRSGEILVLASRPAFDPNPFATGIDREAWSALREDPRTPLHNRVLQGQYPPGSTYKVVPALAALEEGLAGPGFEVECAGSFRLGRRRYRCWRRGGHGRVDLHRAIVESCDVFFYQVGLMLGVDTLARYARMLGLGARTGIELGGEAPGLVPTREWKRRRLGQEWLEGETVSLAIGQGFNLWTPLQLATVYAQIANGGIRYRPFLLKRVENAYGKVEREVEPEILARTPISAASLETVRRALYGVVHEPRGTGARMRYLPGDVEAAAKTGTAQVVALAKHPPEDEEEIPLERRDHAWFVTYLPADQPRIVVAVLVEHGGHGASAAGPIAREVALEFLRNEPRRYAGD